MLIHFRKLNNFNIRNQFTPAVASSIFVEICIFSIENLSIISCSPTPLFSHKALILNIIYGEEELVGRNFQFQDITYWWRHNENDNEDFRHKKYIRALRSFHPLLSQLSTQNSVHIRDFIFTSSVYMLLRVEKCFQKKKRKKSRRMSKKHWQKL